MNLRQQPTKPAPRALRRGRRRTQFTLLFAVIGMTLLASEAQAQYDRNRHGSPGMQQADRHNPFAQGGSSVYGRGGTTVIGGNFGLSYGFGLPYNPYYGGYYPIGNPYYYGSYAPYVDYYRPFPRRRVSYMLPPIVLPADALYGPAALARFFNGTNNVPAVNNPPVIVNVNPGGNAPAANSNAKTNDRGEPVWAREVSLAMRERAWRFIEMGDTAFLNKDYRSANDRYRAASRAAPRLVEAYLKQAQAMIALEKYDMALDAYNRALALPPLWATANFSLPEQYGPDAQDLKKQHLDQLAAAAEKDPNNANLLLLIGMELFYDQQPDRAINFLRRAKELGATSIELPDPDNNGAGGAGQGPDALPIPNPPPVGNDRRIF